MFFLFLEANTVVIYLKCYHCFSFKANINININVSLLKNTLNIREAYLSISWLGKLMLL